MGINKFTKEVQMDLNTTLPSTFSWLIILAKWTRSGPPILTPQAAISDVVTSNVAITLRSSSCPINCLYVEVSLDHSVPIHQRCLVAVSGQLPARDFRVIQVAGCSPHLQEQWVRASRLIIVERLQVRSPSDLTTCRIRSSSSRDGMQRQRLH